MSSGLEHVPTAAELLKLGLADVAERNKKGEASIYSIRPAGYQAIYSAMKHNAKLLAGNDALRRERESLAIRKAKGVISERTS